MSQSEDVQNLARRLAESAADQKGLVAIGFNAYRLAVMQRDAPPIQVSECRMAFFAGAQHLFASIMQILDPGNEPTEQDLRRMSQILEELQSFASAISNGTYRE